MEVAVTVVLGAGIPTVVAKSYLRTYWRNAVNNGLLALVADTSGIAEGDALQVSRDGRTPELHVMSPAVPAHRLRADAGIHADPARRWRSRSVFADARKTGLNSSAGTSG
jgi:3-isopropylmalate/(R)-2-methylmalate dehydratase small subunit